MNIPPMQPRSDEYPSLQKTRDVELEAWRDAMLQWRADCEKHFSLRDTFAAAALAGVLAQGDDGSFSEESYAKAAFRWADAMLRERLRNGAVSGCESVQPATPVSYSRTDEKRVFYDTTSHSETNLDAAPAAKAPADRYVRRAAADADRDRTDKAAPRPCDGTGDTPVAGFATTAEPVAWAVMYPNKEFGILAFYRRDAEDRATASDRVVPLYRHSQPTLTDAERSLLIMLVDHPRTHELMYDEEATLRGLLERMR